MIVERHPKLCSYWNQQNSFPIFYCQFLQATPVEKHDEKLIEENFDFYSDNDLPNNDGTTSCSYLSLGIIDHFILDTENFRKGNL